MELTGKIAVVFGLLVIPAGLTAIFGMVPKARSEGVDIEANIEMFTGKRFSSLFVSENG